MEASQLATLFAIDKQDFLLPTYRDVIPLVKHGMPLSNAVLWYRGHVAVTISRKIYKVYRHKQSLVLKCYKSAVLEWLIT